MTGDEVVIIDGHRCPCTVSEHDVSGTGVLYQAVIELPDGRPIAGPHRPDPEAARMSAWWSAHRVWHATKPEA